MTNQLLNLADIFPRMIPGANFCPANRINRYSKNLPELMSLENEDEPDDHVAQVQGLFLKHQPAVRGYILSMIPDFSLADDLVQETFLVVTRKADSFVLGTSFLAWVRTIARFKVLETLRADNRRPSCLSEEILEILAGEEENAPVEADTYMKHLDHCLGKLAPQARRAIELRYRGDHRPPEIARLLGCTVPSVNVTLSRARAFLRNCVDQQMRTSPL